MSGNPLDEIVRFATERIAPPKPPALSLRVLDKDEVEQIKLATGLTLKKYTHVIDPDGMRHLYKKHSVNPQIDEEPLTVPDLYLIDDIITNPDLIEKSGKTTGRGHLAIKYTKEITGILYIYIAEVDFTDRVIRTKTMYKNRLP